MLTEISPFNVRYCLFVCTNIFLFTYFIPVYSLWIRGSLKYKCSNWVHEALVPWIVNDYSIGIFWDKYIVKANWEIESVVKWVMFNVMRSSTLNQKHHSASRKWHSLAASSIIRTWSRHQVPNCIKQTSLRFSHFFKQCLNNRKRSNKMNNTFTTSLKISWSRNLTGDVRLLLNSDSEL